MRIVPTALLACASLALPAGAAAQTCRTSQSLGTIQCDNGATARTSPVTGMTTFSDGRTAQTSPATGTTRYSDGVLLETRHMPAPATAPAMAIVPPRPPAEASQATEAPAPPSPKPPLRKRRPAPRR